MSAKVELPKGVGYTTVSRLLADGKTRVLADNRLGSWVERGPSGLDMELSQEPKGFPCRVHIDELHLDQVFETIAGAEKFLREGQALFHSESDDAGTIIDSRMTRGRLMLLRELVSQLREDMLASEQPSYFDAICTDLLVALEPFEMRENCPREYSSDQISKKRKKK